MVMGDVLIEITDETHLDTVVRDESPNHRVLLFKHSTSCDTSTNALREVERAAADYRHPCYLMVVQDHPELKERVAETTGFRHQSPQIIVYENGRAIVSASHWGITYDLVMAALNGNQS